MAAKPTLRQIVDKFGLSRSYAYAILKGTQQPRGMIVQIYRAFGWKAPLIAHLNDEQISTIEEAEQLAPTGRKEAA